MFYDMIEQTAFSSVDADYLLQDKIPKFSLLCGDYSLVSTMRALLARKIPNDRSLDVYYLKSSSGADSITDILPLDYLSLDDAFVIVDCVAPAAEVRSATFDMLKRDLPDVSPQFRELDIVAGFFARSFPVLCFVSEEQRTTVLIVQRLDTRKLHYLQTALLVMMPWYYNGTRDDVSEDELALIMSLKETTPDAYQACLNKLTQQYNMREVRTRRLLTDFETNSDRQRKEREEANLRSIDSQIQSHQNYISDQLRLRNETLIVLMGLETKIANMAGRSSELLNYMLRNERVEVRNVEGDTMTLEVFDYLSYYDEDMVERMLRDGRGAMCYNAPSTEARNSMKKLMTKVFVDGELRIRVTAGYRVAAGSGVCGIRSYDSGNSFESHAPNPHIYEYGCLGNYVTTFNNLIRDNDYVGIVETCLASARSLNWGDDAVMNCFSNYMYNDCYRCIELPDGNVVYPSEAIRWIEDEEQRAVKAEELRLICFEEDDYDEIAEEESEDE